jgi:uncharacterized protein (TIGR03437 family)
VSHHRHLCVVVTRLALASLGCAACAQTLTLQVSNEIAPAGGWAQIKISASAPAQVAGGRIVMNFDPSVFGPIASVALFSSTGDAMGVAAVLNGESLDANFVSPSASVAHLPDLPILAVTVPILAGAAAATISAITVDPSQGPWTDENGKTYTVTVAPGSVTIGSAAGSALSVASLTPGGGLLAAGSIVRIAGTGFSDATTVNIAGVSVSNTQFVNPNEIDLTLGGAADLTSKQVVLANPGGASVTFFSSISSVPNQAVNSPAFEPLLAMQTWTSAATTYADEGGLLAIQNPNSVPVDVTIQDVTPVSNSLQTVSIPAGALQTLAEGGASTAYAVSALPLHMMGMRYNSAGSAVGQPAVLPGATFPAAPPLEQVAAVTSSVSFSWQIGTAIPAPVSILLEANSPYTVSWSGVAFSVTTSPLTVAVNPAGLSPGTYIGSITIIPEGPNVAVTTIPLTLTVTASAQLIASASTVTVLEGEGPSLLSISSNGNPIPFTVTASSSSGALWFSVTPTGGTTPAQLSLSPTVSSLTGGVYTGQIVITGPNNTLTIPVQLTVNTSNIFTFSQPSVTFSVQAGSAPPPAQTIQVYGPSTGATVSATTSSGGNWLSVALMHGLASMISVNPAGLSAGTYTGAIVVISPYAPAPVSLPVTLVIWNQQPVLMVNPPSITFTVPITSFSSPVSQMVQVTSSTGVPVNFTTSVQGGTFATPASIAIGPQYLETPFVYAPLGANTSNVTFTSGSQTVTVPVTTIVTTGPDTPPFLGSIVNAASQIPDSVSPGEILTVYGFGAGPSATAGFELNASGDVASSLHGAQILFDGNPAPMLYGSAYQANVIVPYEVAGETTTSVALEYGGIISGAWAIPVAASAPGIFTLGGAGIGQAAVLNQDNTVNSASNAAARGSIVQIYATGEGQTSPPGVTGSVISSDLRRPLLPVTVSIGGQNAVVQYAGSAADSVSGLLQVNAVVPQQVTPGLSVPVVVSVGGVPSQRGATIAVQ